MPRFNPRLPDGPFQITVTCCRCQEQVSLTTDATSIYYAFHRCPSCSKRFAIDPDLDTWSPLALLVLTLLIPPLLVVFSADKFVHTHLNTTSAYLQKALDTDKYTLSLFAFGAGASLFPLLDHWHDLLSSLFWLLIAFPSIQWCWSKRAVGDADSEVRNLEDEEMIRRSRSQRIIWGFLGGVSGFVLFVSVGSLWGVCLYIMNIGHYWMDSEHVPPRNRGIFDWGRQFAFGPG